MKMPSLAVRAETSEMPSERPVLLSLEGIHVRYAQQHAEAHTLQGVDMTLRSGETLALVGESGSGKSTLALASMGLLRPPGYVTDGDISWKGESLLGRSGQQRLEELRGTSMSMIWQDPSATFNPRLTIGQQLTEGMRRRLKFSGKVAEERACELLELVGVAEPRKRLGDYPHQYSGGMLQRVGIAAAIACEPELLIADEPTTALDVTVQAQILALLSSLQRELNLAVLFITHDLAVVSNFCERVAVMYAGRIVESGGVRDTFVEPAHHYSHGLISSMPSMEGDSIELTTIPGSPPDLSLETTGCSFAPRCDAAAAKCTQEAPTLDKIGPTREVACWYPRESDLR